MHKISIYNSKKARNSLFLHLIIYTLFTFNTFSQNLHLTTKGKDSISNAYLKKIKHKTSFKDLTNLKNETKLILKNISNDGYFNHQTERLEKINDSSFILNTKINQQFKEITIKTNLDYLDLIDFTPNTNIKNQNINCNTIDIEKNLNNIIQYLSNIGKTFSSLQLENIELKNNKAFAYLKIEESKENTISNIIIKGYEKFPKKFIKHHLKLKNKQTLNTTGLEKKSSHINNLTFANELKKPQILFSKDSTTIFLYLEKQKSNHFDGYIGFNNDPETDKIEFNGNINLKLINNLNTGEELFLKYLSTADEQRKINIQLKLPYIFNTPFSTEATLNITKQDSTFSTNQQQLLLKYPIHQNINIGTGIRFTKSTTLSENNTNTQDFSKNEYTLKAVHTINQKNVFYPIKHHTIIELSTSNRKTSPNNTQQQSTYLNTSHIFNLNKTNSIYIKNEGYYLFTEDVFENEKHFIGGINSIRGYQESSIPTHIYNYINTEYRINFTKTLYTHTVFDYGINKNNESFDNLFGFGIGFGLKTNNNLLRFVFANNKTNNQKIKFSESQIHLSLSTSF